MEDKIIEFIRKRDYKLMRELGQGACGKTVLLHDDLINEDFVCKKFTPYSEENRKELFSNFIREIKILHSVFHQNIVRVFNFYLYPETFTGYILMEFVDGSDIEDFLKKTPEMINELFLQSISGFRYLEVNNILHRDIRPTNLMVSVDGTLKIIDFGFGKQVEQLHDFDKSVSLNWWCEPPSEFASDIYDFRSEVYFLGKLFERIITDNGIENFKYKTLLGNMCQKNPDSRVKSFIDTEKEIQSDRFFEIGFSDDDANRYRNFADAVETHITRIENNSKYFDDIERIEKDLANAYRSFMLEEIVPNTAVVTRCIIDGSYFYTKRGIPVYVIREFLQLLQSSSFEKKRIILSNLHTRLDAVNRYDEEMENDLPF